MIISLWLTLKISIVEFRFCQHVRCKLIGMKKKYFKENFLYLHYVLNNNLAIFERIEYKRKQDQNVHSSKEIE